MWSIMADKPSPKFGISTMGSAAVKETTAAAAAASLSAVLVVNEDVGVVLMFIFSMDCICVELEWGGEVM